MATNRDEFFNRKFYPPNRHWPRNLDIFAGKDVSRGGTWLGINKSGLCAVLLNRDSRSLSVKKLKSRGELVLKILKNKSANQALGFLANQFENKYKYFNLLFTDYKDTYWAKYDQDGITNHTVPYGFSIIDNLDLNDNNSNKQKLYKKLFVNIKIPDPDKNDFSTWEKMLFLKRKHNNIKKTAVFIDNIEKNYGTVCSSIIGLPNRKLNKKKIIWLYSDRKKKFSNLNPFNY